MHIGGNGLSTNIEQLKERLAPISDLSAVSALLDWDQQVNMPPGGSEARGHRTSTVEYLGARPPNDALGVLQDVRRSINAFGYLPSYALGKLPAA
jgi:Zn-dependent M32 family carboxypeptidase